MKRIVRQVMESVRREDCCDAAGAMFKHGGFALRANGICVMNQKGWMPIFFCPFCGAKVEDVEEGEHERLKAEGEAAVRRFDGLTQGDTAPKIVYTGEDPRKHIGVLDEPLWQGGPTLSQAQAEYNKKLQAWLEDESNFVGPTLAAKDAIPIVDPLPVACPVCFVGSGVPCVLLGTAQPMMNPHMERSLRAQSLKSESESDSESK